jgi:cobalamin biosynthesis protein CobD/CbiB
MVYGRNFMHSLFPDRVDAGASGEEFTITFESREQVVELVSRIKSELSELQEFDAIESVSDSILTALFWVGGTSLSGLWALD